MGRRRCCCEADCIISQDDFDRQDSTNINGPGNSWEEVAGNWEITNFLLQVESVGAVVIHQTPAPEPGEMHVTAYAVNPEVGYKYVLYLDNGSATSLTTYHKAVFTVGEDDVWTVQLYDGTTLLETATMEGNFVSENLGYLMYACIGDGSFFASTGSVGFEPAWAEEDSHGGEYMGLGADGDIGEFNDWIATRLVTADVNCFSCRCHCDKNIIRKILTATFTDCTGRAACLEGLTVTLTYDWNGGTEHWTGTGTGDASGWDLEFICSYGGYAVQFLDITNSWCCTPGTADLGECEDHATAASTCSPLSLVFGPFITSPNDLICTICGYGPTEGDEGEYTIVVTE
jgi:hypothetical protein